MNPIMNSSCIVYLSSNEKLWTELYLFIKPPVLIFHDPRQFVMLAGRRGDVLLTGGRWDKMKWLVINRSSFPCYGCDVKRPITL